MNSEAIQALASEALEELKARDVSVIDVSGLTTVTEYMLIACGTSGQHVRSIAGNLVEKAKHAGVQPLGVEGEREGEWVLVDLGGVVVHIMMPAVREFYQLEKLWGMDGTPDQAESLST